MFGFCMMAISHSWSLFNILANNELCMTRGRFYVCILMQMFVYCMSSNPVCRKVLLLIGAGFWAGFELLMLLPPPPKYLGSVDSRCVTCQLLFELFGYFSLKMGLPSNEMRLTVPSVLQSNM